MDVRYQQLSLDELEFEDLRWAYAYWTERMAGRPMPAWTDIDLSDFPTNLIPRVCVIDVSASPLDFRYRFWGTAITGMHHYDLTGKSVRELTPPDYADCIWNQYFEVLTAGEPAAFMTEVPLERGLTTYYAVVRMPLSAGDGVEQILSVEAYGEQVGELRKRFEALWKASRP